MDVIERIVMQGRDLSQFLLDEIAYLRNLLVVNTIAESRNLLDVSDDVYEALKNKANTLMKIPLYISLNLSQTWKHRLNI